MYREYNPNPMSAYGNNTVQTVAANGTVMPLSIMRVTPAAVEEYFNVSVDMPVEVWEGCCQSVSLVNTSGQDILVDTPLISFSRPDLAITY